MSLTIDSPPTEKVPAPVEYTCAHCGRAAKRLVHLEGRQRHLQRCDPADSELAYGYNAHPADEPCTDPCLGWFRPDPKLTTLAHIDNQL